MKRLAVTGRFIAKGDSFSSARTKSLAAERATRKLTPFACGAAASRGGSDSGTGAGGTGAGGTGSAGGRWDGKLPAQAAGQIGDHAQAVGDRGRDLSARERELRMQQKPGDRGFELGFNGRRGGAAGHGLLALAAVESRANLADKARRSGDGEVDLQRNSQARLFADAVGGYRVALGKSFVDDEGLKLALAQAGEGFATTLGHFNRDAQLLLDLIRAVARAFDSGD
jgi:hypothetical protein